MQNSKFEERMLEKSDIWFEILAMLTAMNETLLEMNEKLDRAQVAANEIETSFTIRKII